MNFRKRVWRWANGILDREDDHYSQFEDYYNLISQHTERKVRKTHSNSFELMKCVMNSGYRTNLDDIICQNEHFIKFLQFSKEKKIHPKFNNHSQHRSALQSCQSFPLFPPLNFIRAGLSLSKRTTLVDTRDGVVL